MNHSIASSLAFTMAAGLALPQSAAAVPFAAQTGVTTISPCPSFCGGPGTIFESDLDGGPGFGVSQSLIPAGLNGTGASVADLNGGGLSLPTLGADAFSENGPEGGSRVSSDAAAMNSYTYRGPTSTFTLGVTLTGHVVNGAEVGDGNLSANLGVVLTSDIDFATSAGTFFFETIPLTPGASLLDRASIDFLNLGLIDTGTQSITDVLAFQLEDGDNIFIWSNLVANGTRGGLAVGGNTFTAEFLSGNVAGLTASYVSPIPVPAAAYLLASGVALLGGFLRWRR